MPVLMTQLDTNINVNGGYWKLFDIQYLSLILDLGYGNLISDIQPSSTIHHQAASTLDDGWQVLELDRCGN